MDVDVLLGARDRDAALQARVRHEAVARDGRVAVEAVDTKLEARVVDEDGVVDVDAVVVQLLERQVDERQLQGEAAGVLPELVVRHLQTASKDVMLRTRPLRPSLPRKEMQNANCKSAASH